MAKGRTIVWSVLSFLALCAVARGTPAQSSTNYQNQEHTVNSGGNPSPVLTSTNYSVTLSSIGDGLSGPGMSSTGYSMDGGFPAPYPPPGEVLDLQFASKASFGWDPEVSVGSYSVYRGLVSGLSSGYGTCLAQGLTSTQATDATTPSAGQCFFYLVTAENRIAEEGTLGNQSNGTPRPNTAPCP
jgi:hypothetical protein